MLGKTLDVKLAVEKIEMAVLRRVNGVTQIKLLDQEELIDDYQEKERTPAPGERASGQPRLILFVHYRLHCRDRA